MLLTVRKTSDVCQYFDLDHCDQALEIIRSNSIDGLYLQYDPKFLDDDRFVQLCKQVPVGVWGRFLFDPDTYTVTQNLLSRGARFVNSDFPDNYFQ